MDSTPREEPSMLLSVNVGRPTDHESSVEVVDPGTVVDQTPIYAELVDELGVADQPSVVAAACGTGVSVDGVEADDAEQLPSSGGFPSEASVRGPQVPDEANGDCELDEGSPKVRDIAKEIECPRLPT